MEQLRQELMLLLFLLISVCCSRAFAQEDYCSLKVSVLSPDGRRSMVTVSMQEKSGRTEEQDQETRDVEFCHACGVLTRLSTVAVSAFLMSLGTRWIRI